MKIKSIICGVLLVASSLFSVFVFPRVMDGETHFKPPEYKGIITMWQIDSFEGGTGSRKQFILKVAREFEKKNSGLLIMVIEHNFDSVKEAIQKGEYPDIISYGNGVEIFNLKPLKIDKFFKGGAVDKSIYSVPWCRGGYCLITKGQEKIEKGVVLDKITLSKTAYNQPALALTLEGIRANEYVVKSPLDAYVDFVSGKTKYLLGTQRDVIRLQNRGVDFTITPLSEYNDLYQYVGITSKDKQKVYYAEEFINFLTSSSVQEKLEEIGMLSCFERVEYQSNALNELQEVNHNYTISAFTARESLVEMHDLALISLKGDRESEIKLKNMLI